MFVVEDMDHYFNEDGLLVMTEAAHLERGTCCGRRCLHCPFEYEGVLGFPDPAPPFLIRRAEQTDATDLALLGRQTFVSSFARFHESVADNLLPYLDATFNEPKIAASLLKRENAWWVAADSKGMIWGYVKLKLVELPQARHPGLQLQKIYLRKQARGHGLGRDLLHTAEAFAKTQSATQIWLTALSIDRPANTFYPQVGYHLAEAFDFRMGSQTFPLVVFARSL